MEHQVATPTPALVTNPEAAQSNGFACTNRADLMEQDEGIPLEEFRNIPTPPPRRVFSVRVRYRHVGKGMPLPLGLEGQDSES